MKVYTKFGDQGKTHLVGGECVNKDNPRVECYGTVDELNSFLGLAVSAVTATEMKLSADLSELTKELFQIQNELFNLGSLLACESTEESSRLPQIDERHIGLLEESIDRMTESLPALKNFIIPGGHELAARLHVARTICRRAERHAVGLLQTKPTSEPLKKGVIYLNRLSDYLFTAARYCNLKLGYLDQLWDKNQRT
jgi:cob(I)alamin adenosyltransferase